MRVCSARYVPAFGRLGRRRSGPPDEHANGHPSTRTGSSATTPRPRPAPHAESRRLQLRCDASRLLSTPLTATAGSLNTRVCCELCSGMGAKYPNLVQKYTGSFRPAFLSHGAGQIGNREIVTSRIFLFSASSIVSPCDSTVWTLRKIAITVNTSRILTRTTYEPEKGHQNRAEGAAIDAVTAGRRETQRLQDSPPVVARHNARLSGGSGVASSNLALLSE